MESEPGALPLERSLIAFCTSGSVGGSARDAFISTWGMRAMASSLMQEGLFKTLLKCSAHLLRMAFFSVNRVDPSALSSGEVPEVCGP